MDKIVDTAPQPVDGEHPYSAAREVRGFVFVSGALSIKENGEAQPGRREALDAALARLEERLATVGARLRDVVKLTYFATDCSLRTEANEQFVERFTLPRPARTFLEVAKLPYGATVEIDAIADMQSDGK